MHGLVFRWHFVVRYFEWTTFNVVQRDLQKRTQQIPRYVMNTHSTPTLVVLLYLGSTDATPNRQVWVTVGIALIQASLCVLFLVLV